MGWKFEVAKMFMYVSFPVGIFHYFNQPKNYEEWVIKTKKEYFPPLSKQLMEQVDKFIYDFNAEAQKKRLDEMERQYKSKP
ncbi:protein PET100 homolog, mitochondrial [Harpegnathos saltator]|uniref:Protein PET100-like protein, mitochondrial n=1 Tax=Harpegnathos saltator TaxID=610380 RepID=E2C486_HARSA|nr:protein PET100 homolog, mitochondrial [Harpegnathos saltator]XP_019700047.1 protein PET100 homolog, mitochondrial [Harpegnathos saltator]EFN77257.1 hypothetical protein EAI_02702 [Harpegnathos saltator]